MLSRVFLLVVRRLLGCITGSSGSYGSYGTIALNGMDGLVNSVEE